MVLKFIRYANRISVALPHHFLNTSYATIAKPIAALSIRAISYQTKSRQTSTMEKTIAIGQMRATNDKLSNRQQVQQIVESAAQQNASVCITEHCFFFYLN